jgi:hypothetical protein
MKTPLDSAFQLGAAMIDRLFPDKIERAMEMRKLEELYQKGDLAYLEAHVRLMEGQLKVNLEEAKHKSIFVAGWRPAVGWLCVAILCFNYICIPMLDYAIVILDLLPEGVVSPARLSMSELWPVLLGMLGIGAQRSYDKRNGVETNRIK